MLAEQFKIIHLITYNRFGFHSTENTRLQAQMLKEKFGNDRIVHEIINVDKLFKHITYENHLRNLIDFGFFNLSTCGLCKLSMHVRTVIYCQDNNIKNVADGANQAMTMFPSQMKEVITDLKRMYEHFNINYFNPVFEMEASGMGDFIELQNLQFLNEASSDNTISEDEFKGETPGTKLFDMGLAPSKNVKGTKYDKARQPRCFQFIPFNIFAKKYFMANKTYEEYRDGTVKFYQSKINTMIDFIQNKDKNKNKKILDK